MVIGQIHIAEVAVLVGPDVRLEVIVLIHRLLLVEVLLRRAEHPGEGIALREQQIVQLI